MIVRGGATGEGPADDKAGHAALAAEAWMNWRRVTGRACRRDLVSCLINRWGSMGRGSSRVPRRCSRQLGTSKALGLCERFPGQGMSDGTETKRAPRENMLVNVACNVVLPGLLLDKLSKPDRLGPVAGLVIALSIPLGYGIYDFVRRRVWNALSVLGLCSVLLTGVLGLLKTDAFWFAVKEAAIPALLAVAIPLSLRTRQPLVRTLLFNDQVLDVGRIESELDSRSARPAFDSLLGSSSWLLASSFLLSSALNYVLARWMLTASPGTDEFNKQLGRMNWVSWPVIFLPMTAMLVFALMRLLKGVERLTGLKADELFAAKGR